MKLKKKKKKKKKNWVFGGGRDEGRIKHNYNKLTQTAMKIE